MKRSAKQLSLSAKQLANRLSLSWRRRLRRRLPLARRRRTPFPRKVFA